MPRDKCDNCGCDTDVRQCTSEHRFEEVVSRGRQHPQTGEYMNVETREGVERYTHYLCISCRKQIDFAEP